MWVSEIKSKPIYIFQTVSYILLTIYHVEPKIRSRYKNAYEIQYLFRKDNSVILMVDDYFAFPTRNDIVQIPLVDQKNGIICAWNPNNQKESLQKFIRMLRPTINGE